MSEVFDEDTGEFRKRTLSNLQVLKFISSYWTRQPVRLAGAASRWR